MSKCNLFLETYASLHEPITNLSYKGDEGAANHLRIASSHDAPGFEIFVHGGSIFEKQNIVQRQALEASYAISSIISLITKELFLLSNPKKQSQLAASITILLVSLTKTFVCFMPMLLVILKSLKSFKNKYLNIFLKQYSLKFITKK